MLEVHQEESPGEPMKTGMELVIELRVREAECGKDLEEPLAALAHYCWKQAADELEAWLREADVDEPPKWFEKVLLDRFRDKHFLFVSGRTLWREICHKLLGTTQEGKG